MARTKQCARKQAVDNRDRDANGIMKKPKKIFRIRKGRNSARVTKAKDIVPVGYSLMMGITDYSFDGKAEIYDNLWLKIKWESLDQTWEMAKTLLDNPGRFVKNTIFRALNSYKTETPSILKILKKLDKNGARWDELCFECKQPGDLVCCAGCCNSSHLKCIGVESIPDEEEWICSACNKEVNAKPIQVGPSPKKKKPVQEEYVPPKSKMEEVD